VRHGAARAFGPGTLDADAYQDIGTGEAADHEDRRVRIAAKICFREGSTPKKAAAPPSMTVSPSTRTLNSPYWPRTMSTSVCSSRRSCAATRTACNPDTQYAQYRTAIRGMSTSVSSTAYCSLCHDANRSAVPGMIRSPINHEQSPNVYRGFVRRGYRKALRFATRQRRKN